MGQVGSCHHCGSHSSVASIGPDQWCAFCTPSSAIFPHAVTTSKRYEIGCQLVLITNGKSHHGLLIGIDIGHRWSWMTLNGVIALFYSIQYSVALGADYVTVVEDRPIMCAEYRLPLLAKFDSRSGRTVNGLSAITKLLVFSYVQYTVCFNKK